MAADSTRDTVAADAPRAQRFLLPVGVALAAKLILARYLVFGEALGPGALADILIVVALMGFCGALGGQLGRRAGAVLATLASLFTLATVLYATYFGQIPGLGVLGSLDQAATLGEDVAELVAWPHILFVIDLPFVLYGAFSTRGAHHRHPRVLPALLGSSALLAFFVFVFAANAGGSTTDSLRTSYTHGITAFQISSIAARQPTEPIVTTATPDAAALTQARIDELTLHRDGVRKDGAPAAGSAEGYNLILIQAEALQDCLIGARVGGKPVMPELEALVGESIYFPNVYSQTGRGNTADAEFIVNTSLYPGIDEPASLAYARKAVPGLPTAFRAAGYESYTFHTNDIRFWNRNQLYPALGFDRAYERSFFGDEELGRYGASDKVLFDRSADELLGKAVGGTRFYAHVITVSAHSPYTAVASRGGLDLPPEIAETPTGRYLQSQAYFDQQLGRLMRELSESGLIRNTVIVIYGDHFGMRFGDQTPAEKAFRAELTGHGYTRADLHNIPLIIRMPQDKTPRRYEEVLGQVDIAPTLADLFGLDFSAPHFGRSAFVDTPSVMTRGADPGTYIDGDAFYVAGVTPGQDRRYVSASQEKIAPGVRPARLGNTKRLLELSHAYASSLPERPDATDEVGIIPVHVGREGK